MKQATSVNAIKAPFDQEILGSNTEGNARLQTAIDALKTAGKTIVEAGTALGLTVNTSL